AHRLQDQIGIRFRRHEQDDADRVRRPETLDHVERSVEVSPTIDEDEVGRRARAGRSPVAERHLYCGGPQQMGDVGSECVVEGMEGACESSHGYCTSRIALGNESAGAGPPELVTTPRYGTIRPYTSLPLRPSRKKPRYSTILSEALRPCVM